MKAEARQIYARCCKALEAELDIETGQPDPGDLQPADIIRENRAPTPPFWLGHRDFIHCRQPWLKCWTHVNIYAINMVL